MLIVYMLLTCFRQHSVSMGASYCRSSDIVYAEGETGVSQTERVKYDTACDNMLTDRITAMSGKQDSRLNADSVSATSVDISHRANNTSSSVSPAVAAVTSRQEQAEHHQPWFLANMTEEHWERLNMMCIVSPSSS